MDGAELQRIARSERREKTRAALRHGRATAEAVEKLGEAARTPDVAEKRRLAAVERLQAAHRRHQDRDVTGDRAEVQAREEIGEKREDLGIGAFGIFTREDLVTHLKIFGFSGGQVFLLAEDLAHVAVAGGLRAVGHVHLHDRHGEVRAQHHLAVQGVVRYIGAGADVLAVEVEKHLGRLQDIGFDRNRPRLAEGGHQAVGLGPRFGPLAPFRRTPGGA